jgi:hypothetical protein
VSVHYVVDQGGIVTQLVREEDIAHHAQPSNRNSIGIEQEDCRYDERGNCIGDHRDPGWASASLMRATALLVRDIATRQGVPLLHPTGADLGPEVRGIIGHGQVRDRTPGRTDPENWDWDAFMLRVRTGLRLGVTAPVSLFVTNPQGLRLGIHPRTRLSFNEIPDAERVSTGVQDQALTISPAEGGVYRIVLTATGSGGLAINTMAADRGGELVSKEAPETSIAGGETKAYTLRYSSDDADFLELAPAPVLTVPPVQPSLELFQGVASGALVVATFSDPAGPQRPEDYGALIDWGDGSPAESGTVLVGANGSVAVLGRHTYAIAGTKYPRVVLSSVFSGTTTATSTVKVFADVSAQIKTVNASLIRNPLTGLYRIRTTLTNIGTNVLSGPIRVLLAGLDSRIRLVGVEGRGDIKARLAYTETGLAYVVIELARLSRGQSISFDLVFDNPGRLPIRYTARTFAG